MSLIFVAAGFIFAAAGCNSQNKLIEKVTFTPSDNLEVVRVSLVFAKNIQSDFAGGFSIKDYGYLFVNPFTAAQQFEVGFDLNTSVFNDQDYVHLAPTTVLPNGIPIGIPNAVVEIRAPAPISPKFDLYGYVDVAHTSWIGAAAMFAFLVDQYFPAGLSLSEVFLRDTTGNPGIIASVFGPELNPDGTVKRNGGIALFANIRQLIGQIHHQKSFYPEPGIILNGPAAAEYAGKPVELLKIEHGLLQGFNGLR